MVVPPPGEGEVRRSSADWATLQSAFGPWDPWIGQGIRRGGLDGLTLGGRGHWQGMGGAHS